ncbi:MAG: tyrosine recombinase XerC [Chloroflexota bacterium]|nr:MAG: tyrosine recombinase XerC [Chloroflexota bacterium]
MNWQTAVEGYWLEKRKNVSEATFQDYDRTFRRFADYHGADLPPVEHIGAVHVRAYLNHLKEEKQLSDKSLLNAWVALSSFWTWAEHELKLTHALRGRVARPRYRRPAIEPYSRADINAMLNVIGKNAVWTSKNGRRVEESRSTAHRDRAILLTLLDTGIRASELCDLLISDYDTKTGRLHIRHGKGNKSRFVWCGDAARKALWRYLAERPDARPEHPLFATRTNQALDRNNLRHMLAACAQRAGVDGVTVHRFRHTFAITFLRNGGSVLELQRLLGHERMDTLRIYVTLAESDLQAAQRRASPADNWRL